MMMTRKAQSREARKLQSAARLAQVHLPASMPPALVLTDPKRTPDIIGVAARLPKRWGVIYRHFGATDKVETAQALRQVTFKRGVKLLIAADPLLALQVRADGVHWPEARAAHSRKWRKRFEIMTMSAHSRAALIEAEKLNMDGALRSAVFPSQSSSAGPPMGPLHLRLEAKRAQIAIYALGGINANNAQTVSNFAGLAAIGSINDAFKPKT